MMFEKSTFWNPAVLIFVAVAVVLDLDANNAEIYTWYTCKL